MKREHPESNIASEAQNCLVDTKLLDTIDQACDSVEREHGNYQGIILPELQYNLSGIDASEVRVAQTSQHGEVRIEANGEVRDHQGDDFSMKKTQGVIINASNREALVISVNNSYGGEYYHPTNSNANVNEVTLAYIAGENHSHNNKKWSGFYTVTYRHMNRVPSNIRENEKLTGGEIIGDYRKIIDR